MPDGTSPTPAGDGIVWIEGLPSAAIDEILLLEDGGCALVFHLAKERLGRHTPNTHNRGDRWHDCLLVRPTVECGGRRCADRPHRRSLGHSVGWKAPPDCQGRRDLFIPSPPIIARDFVHRPLYTGSKIVDTLIPIAKGQRQLIIGGNGIGNRAFARDTIINQRRKEVRCVYVLIGQK